MILHFFFLKMRGSMQDLSIGDCIRYHSDLLSFACLSFQPLPWQPVLHRFWPTSCRCNLTVLCVSPVPCTPLRPTLGLLCWWHRVRHHRNLFYAKTIYNPEVLAICPMRWNFNKWEVRTCGEVFLPFFPRRDGLEMHFVGFLGWFHEVVANLITISCTDSPPFWLCCPKILLSGKHFPIWYLRMKNREMSYNFKNQCYQLIESVFLAQLGTPESPPFAIPTSYSFDIHSYPLIHVFIHIFSKYWLLAYCMLITADTMMNIIPVTFTENLMSPGKFSNRAGRGHFECIFLKSKTTDVSYFTGWTMDGRKGH